MPLTAPPQIPGQQIPSHEAEGLKHAVAQLLDRDSTRFPGAQPVSFARAHMDELKRNEYFMCEKTDGVRCLLFLSYHVISTPTGEAFEPATFLIDRKNHFYEVAPAFRFPYYQFPNDEDKFLFNTLLDGELVHDVIPGQATPRLTYYTFDCLVMDGTNMTPRSLDKRIGSLKQHLFKPYHDHIKTHGAPRNHPFHIKEKQSFPAYSTPAMFKEILPSLPHGNDGLIFTAKKTPYEFGTDRHILKWKPPHENTIDFKLRLGDFPTIEAEDLESPRHIPDYDAQPPLTLLIQHNNNDYQPFAELACTPADWEIMKSLHQRLDGRIIECFRGEDGSWRFKKEEDGSPRWRDDKKDANHISTVTSVLDSINNPVTQQMLLDSAGEVRTAVYEMRNEEEREAKKRKYSQVNGVH